MANEGERKPWKKSWTWGGLIVALLVSWIPLADFYRGLAVSVWKYLTEPAGINQLALNELDGCRSGDLSEEIVRLLDPDKQYRFVDGAEALRICAVETIQSDAVGMARALQAAFPGCFRYNDVTDAFRMIANGDAICQIENNGGIRYICDGDRPSSRDLSVFPISKADLSICGSNTGF